MAILVADDDRVVSKTICSLLQHNGYATASAFDSMQALMMAVRAPHPDAIILDIAMPGGGGIETLRKLKASTRTAAIPVIVVSGSLEPSNAQVVQDLGAETFLQKPVDPQALLGAVVEAIGVAPAR